MIDNSSPSAQDNKITIQALQPRKTNTGNSSAAAQGQTNKRRSPGTNKYWRLKPRSPGHQNHWPLKLFSPGTQVTGNSSPSVQENKVTGDPSPSNIKTMMNKYLRSHKNPRSYTITKYKKNL